MSGALLQMPGPFLGEFVLAAGALLLLAFGRGTAGREKAADLALVVVAANAVGTVTSMDAAPGYAGGGALVVDGLGGLVKFLMSMMALAVVWMSTRARERPYDGGGVGWALFAVSLLGLQLMVSAVQMAVLWVAFTVSSAAGALWVAVRCSEKPADGFAARSGVEAAASSALLLFGIALLCGFSGALDYATMAGRLSASLSAPGATTVALTSAVLMVVGIGRAAAMLPWQGWRADLGRDASPAVAAWFVTVPALAALAVVARLLRGVFSSAAADGAWAPLPGVEWASLVSVAAMATMLVGAAGALRETRLQRSLAWWSVAQAGFLITGLVALDDAGVRAMLFHAVACAAMLLGAGTAFAPLVEASGLPDLEALRGLARRRGNAKPLAAAIAVFMLSLAAMPPLAGYTGRVFLMTTVFEAERWMLALAAVLAGLLGWLSCIRILVTMADRPADADENVPLDFESVVLMGLLLAGTLGLGLWPGGLVSFVERSVSFFGG
ncbi:MAG: proton-conducting transporter membrane subunit [Candidatus Binatia bacterium]